MFGIGGAGLAFPARVSRHIRCGDVTDSRVGRPRPDPSSRSCAMPRSPRSVAAASRPPRGKSGGSRPRWVRQSPLAARDGLTGIGGQLDTGVRRVDGAEAEPDHEDLVRSDPPVARIAAPVSAGTGRSDPRRRVWHSPRRTPRMIRHPSPSRGSRVMLDLAVRSGDGQIAVATCCAGPPPALAITSSPPPCLASLGLAASVT